MGVRDTSSVAYQDHEASGDLVGQQKEIVDQMKKGRDYSRSELSEATGIRLASVCGRVHELIRLGRLAEGPIRECKITGRSVHPVFRVP